MLFDNFCCYKKRRLAAKLTNFLKLLNHTKRHQIDTMCKLLERFQFYFNLC